MLFYSFKGISQLKIPPLTVICMKLCLRGGPTVNVQQMERLNTEQSDVALVRNGLLLLQGKRGQVLKGSSSSILWQVEKCQGWNTTKT